MDETKRDDAPKSPSTTGTQGSGSDTLSAAKISAGTSVGTVGQPARPQEQSSTGPGSIGQGSTGQGFAGQGSTGPGSMGQGSTTQRSTTQGSTGQGSGGWNQGQGGGTSDMGRGQQSSQGVGGSARAAADTARQTASDLRERAGDAMEQASDWAQDQYERGSRQFEQMRDQSLQQFRQARGGIERFVSDNPLMVGIVGLAAGLVIGALLPRTRQEDRAFGQWADQIRDQGMRYAREATQRGREYVEEAFGGDSEDERGEWRGEGEGRGGIRSSGPRYQNH